MARLRFKKPKIAILMSEIISLTVWLFLGDKIITVLEGVVGTDSALNTSAGATSLETISTCTNGSVFSDSWEIMGIGHDCSQGTVATVTASTTFDNTDSGLLGVIGLVMCVMVLMNFVSYN